MRYAGAASLCLIAIVLVRPGHADEIEWRPITANQRGVEIPESATKSAEPVVADATAPSNAPAKLSAYPLIGSPRTPAPIVTTAASNDTPATADAPTANIRTFTLVAEHGYGEQPPPVDAGQPFYVRAEFLMWWLKGINAPPLVTTATPPNFGFLNGNTTQILYGNGVIGGQYALGGRFTAGGWFDACETRGLETNFFFLGPRNDTFRADTGQFPVLTRPIFAPNPQLNRETGEIVSFPPGFTANGLPIPDAAGSVAVNTRSFLWGTDATARCNLCLASGCQGGYRFDLFGGFRYLDLDEGLTIQENVVVGNNNQLRPPLPPATRVIVTDFFGTRNQLFGFPVGIDGQWRNGNWFAQARASVALGVTHQTLLIAGSQAVTPPGGATTVFAGGLLALPVANMGRHVRNAFSVAPEITFNLGYQITPRCRTFVGYNFLYWSNVLRPGDQIDRVIDVNNVPNFVPPGAFPPVNPPRPMVLFRPSDFWVQGLNFGAEFRW